MPEVIEKKITDLEIQLNALSRLVRSEELPELRKISEMLTMIVYRAYYQTD